MEKALNDMLTKYYKDSSYLNDLYDSVSSSLIELTANQSRNESVETEYIVQKWLGSLYSVGASSNAINQIATGLSYLGSGNVEALAGNQSLQTLLALSASRAGKDYATLLTSGLSASDTNDLLRAMVEYLAEIADQTSENKVVRSAFGNIFGLSLSDLKSFANLSSTVNDIYGETLTYTGGLGATKSSLKNYANYLPINQMMDNIRDNILLGTGMMFADNLAGYAAYMTTKVLDDLGAGGITFNLEPWGIGLSATLSDMIKSGLFGVGLLGSLFTSGGFGQLGTENWDASEYNTYGSGFSLRTTGGTSYSATVGNASSRDVQNQTLKEGIDQSNDIQQQTGAIEKDMFEALVKQGDKALVSDIKLSINSIDDSLLKAQKLLDEMSNLSIRKTLNVNVQKINGKDIAGQSVPTSPDEDWQRILTAMAMLIKFGTVMNGFGGNAVQSIVDADKNNEQKSLQDLLNVLTPMLESENGIPVRFENTNSVQDLLLSINNR